MIDCIQLCNMTWKFMLESLAFNLSVKKLGRYFSFEAKNEPVCLHGYHLVSLCTM
jgi:hypothetical protein